MHCLICCMLYFAFCELLHVCGLVGEVLCRVEGLC